MGQELSFLQFFLQCRGFIMRVRRQWEQQQQGLLSVPQFSVLKLPFPLMSKEGMLGSQHPPASRGRGGGHSSIGCQEREKYPSLSFSLMLHHEMRMELVWTPGRQLAGGSGRWTCSNPCLPLPHPMHCLAYSSQLVSWMSAPAGGVLVHTCCCQLTLSLPFFYCFLWEKIPFFKPNLGHRHMFRSY